MPVLARTLLYRRWIILFLHLLMVAAAYLLAFLLRFDFRMSVTEWSLYLFTLPPLLVVRGALFGWFHLYKGLWRYVSMRDILAILKAVTLSSIVFSPGVWLAFGRGFPRSIFLLDWVLCLALVGGVRLALRAFRESSGRYGQVGGRRALVIGAGDGGEMLVREIERNASLQYAVVGFADDDVRKQGRRIHGIEVLGNIDRLPELCHAQRVEELLIAIPSATGTEMRRIIGACHAARVEFKTLPSLRELMEKPFTLSKVRRVKIDDLLRREPVKVDHAVVERLVRGKRILVTGAGGSIGSELCRQLARFGPKTLVLIDRAENNLFFVELELRNGLSHVAVQPVIGDVTDEGRIRAIFRDHQPEIVFHAAAHKHVPLMELNKGEAVKNNVLGTMVVANAASHQGVENFVLISTDKAVRPSSVMGATKRLGEMYVQALNARTQTKFIIVRFGNVLGSEGSVLQVFQRQIEAGGPLTITHPEMKRYFMTIPEAIQLVLQAAAQGKGGEIFVLDMGEPVRIVDLARDLIALSGLQPEKDIEIKYTKPRPGEKLFEELLNPETRILPTSHEKIMVVETDPLEYSALQAGILELLTCTDSGDEGRLLAKLSALVPDYVNGAGLAPIEGRGGKRILLVEDDPYTRTTLKRILENGYQIFEAQNPREALLRLGECKPDLVILDFHLPRANIRRLCARIKREYGNRNVPIMILAKSAETASLKQVLAVGADDRIYKPIPVSILESRVGNLLRQRGVGEK